jgi:hypothetical protein
MGHGAPLDKLGAGGAWEKPRSGDIMVARVAAALWQIIRFAHELSAGQRIGWLISRLVSWY